MPYALSLAGLDPSGGAGLLADIKTFEAWHLRGLGVCTALTVQTDTEFLGVEWISADNIIAQALPLVQQYPVDYCKIGIVSHPETIAEVIAALRAVRPGIAFVLDPVLRASAGYVFHNAIHAHWASVLPSLTLLTPNYDEAVAMSGLPDGETGAKAMAQHCAVLLKGGHRPLKPGVDTLFHQDSATDFAPVASNAFPKHGSGCVLSAAITAALASGLPLEAACSAGKDYTYRYLVSSPELVGWHAPERKHIRQIPD
ncbi:hydroxymethylpyrimidine/phosphomethylpyrimidine kinase [Chitinophaga caseinilytica]|uniref:hydroxymethylpyrimidine/phosphomethylpyrimidine kinase n=1 Tax=Chitinophaga caseinilytica TaxID=2267521 RepID=UPI003C2D3785